MATAKKKPEEKKNKYPSKRKPPKNATTRKVDDKLPEVSGVRAPAHLNAKAKEIYLRYGKDLKTAGLLRGVDESVLASFAQAYADVIECRKKIKQTGGLVVTSSEGDMYHNPWCQHLKRAENLMISCADRLALHPRARKNVRVPIKDPGDNEPSRPLEDDPMAKFFREGK